MAEGLLDGALGGDEEKAEVEAPRTLAAAEAFASAVAARLSEHDPEVARKTEAFLESQTRLLDTQRQHLEQEHALRLTQLRHQAHLLRGQRIGQAIRVAFQIVVSLLALIVGVGIVVMLHDAFTSRGVVIEPFQTPPALAARGQGGTVVAGAVLDELTRLQRATRPASVSKRDLSSAWTHELKLAVPETGISLSEITAMLATRFGHEVRIDGDLVELDKGNIALTVRGRGIAPRTFTGPASEIDQIEIRAGDYLYAESQPVLWAVYLWDQSRFDQALAFIKSVYPTIDPADRPLLLLLWGSSVAKLNPSDAGRAQEESYLQQALRLNPEYWVAYINLMDAQITVGNEERAWHTGEQLRRTAGGVPGRAPAPMFKNWYLLVWDLPGLLRAQEIEAASTAGMGFGHGVLPLIAAAQAALHDPAAARVTLETLQDTGDLSAQVEAHFARALLAMELEDPTQAAQEMERFGALLAEPSPYACWIAAAEEAAGHPDKADAALKAVTHSYVDCERFRGDLLAHRGNWDAAQQAYAAAVALAPDLPPAYYSWGVALKQRGDLPAAAVKLAEAHARGPHWADPLKAWGDVLQQQGKSKEALVKYDEALLYAPNWSALKQARAGAGRSN